MKEEPLLRNSGARAGVSQQFYFRICEASYIEFLANKVQFDEAKLRYKPHQHKNFDEEEKLVAWSALEEAREKVTAAAVKAIVFAAMCLEAAIYDYAAWYLGDDYTQKHLDKLDLLSKWLVIPKLIADRELPSGRPSYEHLKALINLRNKLVHSKSAPMPDSQEELFEKQREISNGEDKIHQGSVRAMRAVILLSLDMDFIFSDLTINPLPKFGQNTKRFHRPRYSEEVEALIAECRGILSRSRKERTSSVIK